MEEKKEVQDPTEAFDRIAAIDPEEHRIEVETADKDNDDSVDDTGLAGKIPLSRQEKTSLYKKETTEENKENEESKKEVVEVDVEDPHGHFTYSSMLSAAYDKLGDHEKGKLKIRPPEVSIQGGKHCVLDNYSGICQDINRDSDHIMKFILAELGTTGSINGEGGMVLSGRFKPNAFEKIIRNYSKAFVLCPNCRSSNTIMSKRGRLTFIDCSHCTSSVVVRDIEGGYVAKTKGNKKAMALAAAGGK